MYKNKSLIMASRLKQLREKRKLSHVALSLALKQEYNIEISRDSLMSYEVSDPNHSKAYKNVGMRVEYLLCLSDFYDVSADYLLGLTDDPNRKPCAADELGLKQEHINLLSLAAKIVAADVEYRDDASYMLTDDMRQLLPILEANQFLSLFESENYMVSKHCRENQLALSAIVFSRLLGQFIGDMVEAVQQNGRILRDYEAIPGMWEIEPPQASNELHSAALCAGYEILPVNEYARFKSSEIGKAIDRYLLMKHVTDKG